MKIELHSAASKDKAWLEELRRVVYRDLFIATWGGWDEDRHQRHWADFLEKGNIYMIKVDTFYAGMVQILEHQKAVEIAEIQILPAFQGRGIGSQVIKGIISKAGSNQKAATLSVGLKNLRAIELYRRLGFTEIEKTDVKLYFERLPST